MNVVAQWKRWTTAGMLGLAVVMISPVPAAAATGKCMLSVSGRVYMNSRCNVDTSAPDGSFSIGTGEHRRSKYFAMVNVDPTTGFARGYWNGKAAESHAHEELGILVKQGSCWVNDRARICAPAR